MRMKNHHHHHAEEKLCSERRERSFRLLISGFFTRKKKKKRSSAQESSEDSRVMRRNKASNFHLSLSEIMRKLKHSFKKEKPQHDKRLLGKKRRFQRSLSTTKDHFFLERMTSISQNRSEEEHHENVKHLSKMFNNGNSNQSLSTREEARRRIVSLPEYSSPFSSPGRRWDQNSTVLSRSASDEFKDIEAASPLSQGSSHSISRTRTNQIDDNIFTFELSKVEADDGEKETSHEESLQQPSHYISRTDEYSLALEPLFIEYEISPTRGEAKRQQLCNQFEEKNEKETVFKYVKAVLDAIDSSWEEMYLKTEFSDQILNPALISNIPFYPTQLCADHELLFDCINELLFELCGFPQWVSFVKPRTQVFSFSAEGIVHQVQKEVYCRLFPLQFSDSLDRIIREDIAKSTNWLDVRCDVKSIGFETSDMILNELLEQLMLDL